MAYHESFWVVAGTAGPVVALSAIVVIGQVGNLGGPGDWNRVERYVLWYGAYAAATASLILDLGLFGMGLASLAKGRDVNSTNVAGNFAIGGISLLLAATSLTVAYRAAARTRLFMSLIGIGWPWRKADDEPDRVDKPEESEPEEPQSSS